MKGPKTKITAARKFARQFRGLEALAKLGRQKGVRAVTASIVGRHVDVVIEHADGEAASTGKSLLRVVDDAVKDWANQTEAAAATHAALVAARHQFDPVRTGDR